MGGSPKTFTTIPPIIEKTFSQGRQQRSLLWINCSRYVYMADASNAISGTVRFCYGMRLNECVLAETPFYLYFFHQIIMGPIWHRYVFSTDTFLTGHFFDGTFYQRDIFSTFRFQNVHQCPVIYTYVPPAGLGDG